MTCPKCQRELPEEKNFASLPAGTVGHLQYCNSCPWVKVRYTKEVVT